MLKRIAIAVTLQWYMFLYVFFDRPINYKHSAKKKVERGEDMGDKKADKKGRRCPRHKIVELSGLRVAKDDFGHFTICPKCGYKVYVKVDEAQQGGVKVFILRKVLKAPMNLKKIAREGQDLVHFIPAKHTTLGNQQN